MQTQNSKFLNGFAGKAVCCSGFIRQLLTVPVLFESLLVLAFFFSFILLVYFGESNFTNQTLDSSVNI